MSSRILEIRDTYLALSGGEYDRRVRLGDIWNCVDRSLFNNDVRFFSEFMKEMHKASAISKITCYHNDDPTNVTKDDEKAGFEICGYKFTLMFLGR